MPHVPSLPIEIAQRVLGRYTTLRNANTMHPNGELATLAGLIADELSVIDRALADYIKAYGFEGRGELLDFRVRQLPRRFPSRQGARAATGGAVRLRRGDTSAEVTYQPGEITASPRKNTSLVYSNVDAITFGVGVSQAEDVTFTCATPGAIGTLTIGELNQVVGSSDGNITFVRNTGEMIGHDVENDDDLRARAMMWLGSLAQSQRNALESVALNFVSSTGETALHARCYSDPDNRGFSVLTVDNGAAFVGSTQPAATMSGVFPTIAVGRRHFVTFDPPAVTSPKLTVDGVVHSPSPGSWSALLESGELWLNRDPGFTINPGMTWSTGGHTIYKPTSFIAQLQAYINRYCVAEGTRVAVHAAQAQVTSVGANVVWDNTTGVSREELFIRIREAIRQFVRGLAPGEPLRLFQLIPRLHDIPGVVNVIFDHGDIYLGSPRHRLLVPTPYIYLR